MPSSTTFMASACNSSTTSWLYGFTLSSTGTDNGITGSAMFARPSARDTSSCVCRTHTRAHAFTRLWIPPTGKSITANCTSVSTPERLLEDTENPAPAWELSVDMPESRARATKCWVPFTKVTTPNWCVVMFNTWMRGTVRTTPESTSPTRAVMLDPDNMFSLGSAPAPPLARGLGLNTR